MSISEFLGKLVNFFDWRFIAAYWGPVFFGLILMAGLVTLLWGPDIVMAIFIWWARLDGTAQVLLAVGILLSITCLASLSQALTAPLVRLYEGYWPKGWLKEWAIGRQRKKKGDMCISQELEDQKKALHDGKSWESNRAAYDACYYHFPQIDRLLKPTWLGNVLAAAEEYSYQRYRLDAAIWWSRLAPLLPEKFCAQIDATLYPMVTLLNMSTILSFLTLAGAVSALWTGWRWWLSLAILGVGFLSVWLCYFGAISQATSYGQCIRVAFDLYRHEILRQMHISVPDNFVEERLLWEALNPVFYEYKMPWVAESGKQLRQLARPFYYDTYKARFGRLSRKKIRLES